jgi:hypothetical protein
MAEGYLTLPRGDRLEALGVAATASGRPVHLLEKDIWVVWAIDGPFSSEFGKHLVFKGGTSLSKAYDVIGRFSDDIEAQPAGPPALRHGEFNRRPDRFSFRFGNSAGGLQRFISSFSCLSASASSGLIVWVLQRGSVLCKAPIMARVTGTGGQPWSISQMRSHCGRA